MSPVCAVSVKVGHRTAAFPLWKNYATQLWQIINDPGRTGSYFHTGTAIHCWISFLVCAPEFWLLCFGMPPIGDSKCNFSVTSIRRLNYFELFNKQMQNTTHSRLTILEPTLHKNFHWKSSCGISQIAQTSWRSLQNQVDPVREMDGQRWMEKQHIFIYSEKPSCTEMPTQKHLG